MAVEKVAFLEKLPKFGDRKCPGDPRESFIGHPDAILFSRLSREGVFQQPRLSSRAPGPRNLMKVVPVTVLFSAPGSRLSTLFTSTICEPRTKGSVFPSWLLMRRRRLRSDHCPAPWWGNRGSFFQCRPNLAALLSAQRRELESILCSQCTNNFCRDHLFVAVRQRDFERYGFA